jgi:NADPH-dependent ferric siderophore reductase
MSSTVEESMTSSVVVPWRVFTVEVRAVRALSPSFVRVTFTGDDLDQFADKGYDQRIKLIFPVPGAELRLPCGPDWYRQLRALPEELRNPVRTYTVRAVRKNVREVDVDLVLHGDGGPASRWAGSVAAGDRLGILGPDAGFAGEHGGYEFRPPAAAARLLLAGDETAVPAICAILERLPAAARGDALLEVPYGDDQLAVAAPAGVAVRWLAREGAVHGSQLIPAVVSAAAGLPAAGAAQAVNDVDVDQEILWESPEPPPAGSLYAWLAGEAGVIRTLRRHLVAERGLDRECVAFMGYWRLGRVEGAI